jgi:hypothetical protein
MKIIFLCRQGFFNMLLLYGLFISIPTVNLHSQDVRAVDLSIMRGVDFIHSSTNQENLAMISPLIAMLEYNFNIGLKHPTSTVNPEILQEYSYFLKGFSRMFDKEAKIDPELLSEYKEDLLNYIMFNSFNCHLFIPDTLLLMKIKEGLSLGGYDFTHAFLSIRWLEEFKCLLKNGVIEKEIRLLKHVYWNDLIKLARIEKNKDLRYESVAIAYHFEKKVNLTKQIRKILSEQDDDGSWYNNGFSDASREHTTILALWALLEWKNKDIIAKWVL